MQHLHYANNTGNKNRAPRWMRVDHETLSRDAQSPTQAFDIGREEANLYIYPNLARTPFPSVGYINDSSDFSSSLNHAFNHLRWSEENKFCSIKNRPYGDGAMEHHFWAGSPLQIIARAASHRLLPALVAIGHITGNLILHADWYEFLTNEWLPMADRDAETVRMIDRQFSRTQPVANYLLPRMDVIKGKFDETVYFLRDEYPELPIRVRG